MVRIRTALGFPSKAEREFAKPERLADVMALIQVLALGPLAHRSPEGLRGELRGPPRSGGSWESVAAAHPEFFRVLESGQSRVSLIARHVIAPTEDGGRAPLTADFVGNLLRSAVEIHDRQVRRNERWTYLIPIWTAVLTALITGTFGISYVIIRPFFV